MSIGYEKTSSLAGFGDWIDREATRETNTLSKKLIYPNKTTCPDTELDQRRKGYVIFLLSIAEAGKKSIFEIQNRV